MSVKEMKNVAASVLARLRNVSRSSGAPFQQVLQQYAIERFLYRISKSTHVQGVVLKGALLLKTIGIQGARPTMDIDMLRKGNADQASLVALVKDCATLEVEADGLTFPADTVVAEEITKDSEYKGARILMDARMDNVRLRIQIDFGMGDVMVTGAHSRVASPPVPGNFCHSGHSGHNRVAVGPLPTCCSPPVRTQEFSFGQNAGRKALSQPVVTV